MKKNSGFVTNICIWLERFLRFKLFHCIFKCILTITAIRQSMHFFPTNLTLNLKQPFYIHINRFSGASVVEEERVSISNAFRHARIIVQFLSKKLLFFHRETDFDAVDFPFSNFSDDLADDDLVYDLKSRNRKSTLAKVLWIFLTREMMKRLFPAYLN